VWSANQSSSNVTAIDPKTAFCELPSGGSPYTYSDLQEISCIHSSQEVRTKEIVIGQWFTVDSCRSILGCNLPGSTTVKGRVRVASTIAGLATAPWYPDVDVNQITEEYFTTSPTNLSAVPAGGTVAYMEVQMILLADGDGHVPTLTSFTVSRNCPQL
jgi:hypothetical protein